MKRKNLRKVTFSLMQEPGFDPYLTEKEQKEQDDLCRIRKGYFHQWIPVESKSPYSENHIIETEGLVEDAKTGKMEMVPFSLITFKS